MSERSDNSPSTEQPTGLFAYIAGQPSATVEDGGAVNPDIASALGTSVSAGSTENAPEGLAAEQITEPTTQVPSVSQADYLRLQQEKDQLEAERERQLGALVLLGQESGKRELALFEQSIANMDDEEKAVARDRRRLESLEAQNQWLQNTMTAQSRQDEARQAEVDKGILAHKLLGVVGLVGNSEVYGLLMETTTPQEMIYRAKGIHAFNQRVNADARTKTAVQAQRSGVHAGGDTGLPAQPDKPVSLRSNDLIGMMRERQYVAE